MPLFSRLLKAEQVAVTEKICRLAYHEATLPAGAGGSEAPGDANPVTCVMVEAEERASEMLAAAARQSAEILTSASSECEELLHQSKMKILILEEEARKRGYDKGYLEGLGAGQTVGIGLQREAEAMLREAVEFRERVLERVEPQVVELAVCVAEKLVGRQLTIEPETVVTIVREALRLLNESGEILIRLHPGDLLLCQARLPDLQAEVRENSSLNLFADPQLPAGSCRVETNGALIECMLDERFVALRAALADVANHG
ncbi:MAG: hypothetical protein DDT30_00010 [Dehalococcoidia bacterium]|nr:hypothetical protein [Bacillota bacterium]